MNDETRNTIAPDDSGGPDGRDPAARDRDDGAASDAAGDRGMPSLGQYRPVRPGAWWLTPLLIVLLAGAGAVWTIHTFVARHDAQAKAQRDALADAPGQGRVFREMPAAASAASAPSVASTVVPAPAPVGNRQPAVAHPLPAHSYYDAPLLVTGGPSGEGGQPADLAGAPPANDIRGGVTGTATSVGTDVTGRTGGIREQRGAATLADALTATATPRVRAGMLGNRSLVLAQGAKVDCVGDTAFDSTEAGLSTCTVTRNVYSDDGRVVLIERGSQINSQYRSNPAPGQKRAFILAARIETPHGVTVEINSPAADALGRMGIDGFVDNHWRERIGAAMLLGLTQDAIGYLATRGGNSNGSVVYENTQQQGNDMATRVLDSTINIPPTLTQNQGAEFTIVIARDLDFSSVYALQPEDTR